MLPTVYLHEITFANLPYAVVMSLRYRVVAWKVQVPNLFASRFARLRAHELFSWDEWMLLEDACYAKWKQTVLPHYHAAYQSEAKYRRKNFNFSRILWQHLGSSYERLFLFLSVVRKHQNTCPGDYRIVTPLIARTLPTKLVEELSLGQRLVSSPLANFFEAAHYWSTSFLQIISAIRFFARGLLAERISFGPKKIFWTGISPAEIPDSDKKLNFAWITQYGELPREDVLFFLPSRPNAKQLAYLDSKRIDFVDSVDMYRLIPRRRAVYALSTALGCLVTDFLSRDTVSGSYRSRFLARTLIWYEIAREHKAGFYFTTTSGCWPERPEVAALKELGVRTVIWGYSANNLRFTKSRPEFRDNTVYRSFFVADEYWTWNRAVAEWLERIQIRLVSDSIQFRAIGANMCGNREYLQLSSAQARRMIGMPEAHFVIGVFDVPALSNDWMEHAAGGPRLISLEYAEAFFHGVNALLEKLPGVSIFLKLKRALDEDLRAYPGSLRRLLERGRDGTGRVTVLDVNIDPFLPIAACDAALGMFFTSPVLLALANGRKGGYYDPLGAANHPTEKEYLQFILRSEDSLISAVRSWIEKREQPQVPSSGRLLPRTVKNSFRHYCYNAPPRESESRHG